MSVRLRWLSLDSHLALGEPEPEDRDLKAESRQAAERAADLRRESEEIRAQSAELIRRAEPILERARRLQKQGTFPEGESLAARPEASGEDTASVAVSDR